MDFIQQIRVVARPFCFIDAIVVAATYMTSEQRQNAWKRLGHGVPILESDERLNDYLVAYGEMHIAKVRKFLPSIPFGEMKSLAIVDWGCGQGLAAAVTLEYIRKKFPELHIAAVRLIEISNAARRRAYEIVSRFENCSDIRAFSWDLNALSVAALGLPVGVPVLHLFSNILDVVQSELSGVAEIVDQSAYGRPCHVLCVGPKGCSANPIREFYNKFEDTELRTADDQRIAVGGRYYQGQTCSCYGILFSLVEHAIPVSLPEVRFYPDDLFAFASADMADEVRQAIQHGVPIESTDVNGFTPIILAAKYGAEDALRALVDFGGNVNYQTDKGVTALYFAAKYGNVGCVRYLLSVGAEKDPVIIKTGLTPALVAAKYGHRDCLEVLCEAGCNMNACNVRGQDIECLLRLFSHNENDGMNGGV